MRVRRSIPESQNSSVDHAMKQGLHHSAFTGHGARFPTSDFIEIIAADYDQDGDIDAIIPNCPDNRPRSCS